MRNADALRHALRGCAGSPGGRSTQVDVVGRQAVRLQRRLRRWPPCCARRACRPRARSSSRSGAWRRCASGVSGSRLPPAGHAAASRSAHRRRNRCVDSMPRAPPVVGRSSTAPAPSPNSTQVSRSVQSTMRDSTSTPTTSTFLNCPARMKRVGDRQAVEEAGAGRRQIERAAARRARPASSARTSRSAGNGSRR